MPRRARGQEILDIDFTGGSSVQLLFAEDKPHDIADVRRAVEELPDVAVSSVGDKNLEFKVDTSEPGHQERPEADPGEISRYLQAYKMSFGEIAMIDKPKAEEESEGPALVNPQGANEKVPAGEQAAPADKATEDKAPRKPPPSQKAKNRPMPSRQAEPGEATEIVLSRTAGGLDRVGRGRPPGGSGGAGRGASRCGERRKSSPAER